MTKLTHTRPFNLEHARAGAPVAMLNEWPFEIFKWDSKLPGFPIVGMCGEGRTLRQASWTETGGYGISGTSMFDLVMTPLGFIDGKPVFVGDELVMNGFDPKCTAGPTTTQKTLNGFRWPAPAKVYPETRMAAADLHVIYLEHQSPTYYAGLTAIANAALRHAIDAEQVVPMAEVLEVARMLRKREFDQQSMELGKAERLIESLGYRSAGNGEWKAPAAEDVPTEELFLKNLQALEKSGRNTGEHAAVIRAFRSAVNDVPHVRAARDMAIAEAVRDACRHETSLGNGDRNGMYISMLDLAAIIAKVPS